MNTAPNATIIQRDTPRSDLLAFEIKDRITQPDMEWMSSISDAAMKGHGKIDMLIIMSNYEGSDSDAKHDDYSNKVKAKSVDYIRNYVVVGAPMFARAMIASNGLIKPVDTKTFSLSEENEAWDYLAAAGPITA